MYIYEPHKYSKICHFYITLFKCLVLITIYTRILLVISL
jgi:hypothetical protein